MPTAQSTLPTLTRLDRDDCQGLERALGAEWLETDGLGGYASSTATMCATRRYHGLLVSVPPGSKEPHLFLSRFEEELDEDGRAFPLSMARYPDVWAPQGHQHLESFELAPWPRAVYRVGETELVREVLMVRGAPTVLVRWTLTEAPGVRHLDLRPFLPCRSAGALSVRNDVLDETVERFPRGLVCRPYAALPEVTLSLDRALGAADTEFHEAPTWYTDVEYTEEARRGYDDREDQWSPGVLRVGLTPGESLTIAASIDGEVVDPAALFEREVARRRAELERARPGLAGAADLAAGAFLVRSDDGTPGGRPGVVAGYPWFGEWGRDTYISLPGLTLARGDVEGCTEVLSSALGYLKDGLLPNRYGRGAEASEYHSIDAALWFARAVSLYEKAAGHDGRVRVVDEYGPALFEIATRYWEGTGLGVRADEESALVRCGPEAAAATWMDAHTEDEVYTPRDGYPVEINALWYSLLDHLEDLAKESGDRALLRTWRERRRLAKRSFLEKLWLEDHRYLADRWVDGAPDKSIRPNMVIAASLAASPLTRDRRADVVRIAKALLVTPRGLRTLAPDDSAYTGTYGGGTAERDAAYHQGTVWPWLLGFYTEAHLRAFGTKRKERDELLELWQGLAPELGRAGLGHVSEVFDGDLPHAPNGTIAQAWNTAEMLRALDMLGRTRL
jgi:predicted glycogen debranching enzyme